MQEKSPLNELLDWCKEYENMPCPPTLSNMKEKIWQLLPKEVTLETLSDKQKSEITMAMLNEQPLTTVGQIALLKIAEMGVSVNSDESVLSTEATFDNVRYECRMVVTARRKRPISVRYNTCIRCGIEKPENQFESCVDCLNKATGIDTNYGI